MKETLIEKITKSLIEERWFVYKHTSPEGKVYIGITRKLPRERWGRGEGYKENTDFYADIQKFGWDEFTHEIIDRGLTEQQALDEEDRLIKEYNCLYPNGYNRRHNRAGRKEENDMSDLEDYAATKKKTIKNNIYKFYKEYLQILQPKFSLLEYLENKVPLPKPANKAVHIYFPQWIEEIYEENSEEIEEITEQVNEYKEKVSDFYQKKKEFISMAGEGCSGSVFTVDDGAYYDETIQQLITNFKEKKPCADLLYTILKRATEEEFFNQLVELKIDPSLYEEFKKSCVWEARIETFSMPLMSEKFLGEKCFMAALYTRNVYISLFEEEYFLSEKNRFTFKIKEEMVKQILEIFESLGAEEIPYRINSFSVVDKEQYNNKLKDKIHYRLRRILNRTKQNNLQQYNFMKKKMNIYYSFHDMKISDLEEKLYQVENICSYKQEKYIEFLVAESGLKLKSNSFVQKNVARFLITNLKDGKTDCVERYQDLFTEL